MYTYLKIWLDFLCREGESYVISGFYVLEGNWYNDENYKKSVLDKGRMIASTC